MDLTDHTCLQIRFRLRSSHSQFGLVTDLPNELSVFRLNLPYLGDNLVLLRLIISGVVAEKTFKPNLELSVCSLGHLNDWGLRQNKTLIICLFVYLTYVVFQTDLG